jgi:hypothetical protein
MADPDAGDVGQEIARAWRHGGTAFRMGSGGAAMKVGRSGDDSRRGVNRTDDAGTL